ncbi:hypothetical protein [Micromonospora sp. RP3T]|uniref:hypothetical protein n=1 Tax=Micromonospora sp. RP3T TaxID=2135446 RepID=UPI003D7297A0
MRKADTITPISDRTVNGIRVAVTHSEKFREYTLTIDGETIATAHAVNIVWSIKVGGKFNGIAQSDEAARRALDTVADQFLAALAGA